MKREENEMEQKQLDELSKIFKADLTPMERLIILRVVLYNDPHITSESLGEAVGVSRQSIFNLLWNLKKKRVISTKAGYNHKLGKPQRTMKILAIPDRHGR